MTSDNNKKAGGGKGFAKVFGDIANRTSQAAGRATTFMVAAAVVVIGG